MTKPFELSYRRLLDPPVCSLAATYANTFELENVDSIQGEITITVFVGEVERIARYNFQSD